MAIGTVEFDLALKSPDTGEYLTARTYTVEGVNNVDGTPRELSIGQLVMAICLQRATLLEAAIIGIMEEMNATSAKLEAMTKIEQDIVDTTSGWLNLNSNYVTYDGTRYSYKAFLSGTNLGGLSNVPDSANSGSEQLITDMEAAMDDMNSFSQQKMIELQSETSKRDQTYDMISNVLKSLNTVLVGIANNT